MTTIVGRLLRAGTSGFVAGCQASQYNIPSFGALVRVSPEENDNYKIYGIINDIHIDEDGLIRQLVTTENITAEVMKDNREKRIVPLEMSVLAIGYEQNGKIYHLLPPRPPLSLDVIYLCNDQEINQFVSAGRFGYFRHILRAKELPIGELFATHFQQVKAVNKDSNWSKTAVQELMTLLRDDYPTLMSILGALRDVVE